MQYILKIKIDEKAPEFVKEHYLNFKNHHEGDSGIDLIIPYDIPAPENDIVYTIDHLIQTQLIDSETNKDVSYYLYPRSSISKTPFMMANSVGIIDAGYRGNIMAKVRKFGISLNTRINSGDKLFQICAPDLKSIQVLVVSELSETSRGDRGFGSTNKLNPGFMELLPSSPKSPKKIQ